jgi:hypothetical protein
VSMSQLDRQRVTMTGGADAPPLDARLARLIHDFPGWDIEYEGAGIWGAERKPSPTSLELHCARNLGELRAKLAQAGQ